MLSLGSSKKRMSAIETTAGGQTVGVRLSPSSITHSSLSIWVLIGWLFVLIMEAGPSTSRIPSYSPHMAALARKVAELESERAECDLVLETLSGLESEITFPSRAGDGVSERLPRRCWQQVGNILVERRKEEIVPLLESQRDRLQQVIEELQRQLRQAEASTETEAQRPS
jgi:chaperonin cofactor prefoldin